MKEFAYFGIPSVFYPHRPTYDNRFYDSDNTWYRYSNEPLRRSLERFAKFPIATAQEENQPRLLLVAVDVADGIPVTFDSYPKEDGLRKTEYGRFVGHNNENLEHVIHYDKGITSDHVMASGSYPVNFDFAKIEVESYNSELSSSNRQMDLKKIGSSNGNDYSRRKEMRYFWDGGLMTNTPLMQLVVMHRNYWYKVRGLKDTVPRLGICVINLHPHILVPVVLRAHTYLCRTCGSRFQLIRIPPPQYFAKHCPYCGHTTIEPHQFFFC